VRRELGDEVKIFYDEYGAPGVNTPNTYISISHSRGRVAVLVADRPCAVDIECANRDFRKVACRYLSDEEITIAEEYDLYAEMWSAKEALYKYYRKGGLDLVKEIVILEYNPSKQHFVASICEGKAIVVDVLRQDNLVMATVE
jgi:phosphopantetheinyl transferase